MCTRIEMTRKCGYYPMIPQSREIFVAEKQIKIT